MKNVIEFCKQHAYHQDEIDALERVIARIETLSDNPEPDYEALDILVCRQYQLEADVYRDAITEYLKTASLRPAPISDEQIEDWATWTASIDVQYNNEVSESIIAELLTRGAKWAVAELLVAYATHVQGAFPSDEEIEREAENTQFDKRAEVENAKIKAFQDGAKWLRDRAKTGRE